MKKIIFLVIIISSLITAQTETSKISSMPGGFSRLGFGARGIGMGNALSAVTDGNLVSYYNPALGAFQNGNSFQTSYSFLTLDRSLNFLNFTKRFEFGKIENEDGTTKPRSIAGVSVGIINSGVSKIDARDSQGKKFADLSTSENQFFVAVSNRFSDKLTVGIAFKFYYYKLYEEVTSTGVGFDLGALYSFNESLTLSLMLSDINSKYEWDTGNLYGQSGNVTRNRFPLIKKFGAAYKFIDQKLIAAVEFESSNAGTNYLRAGAEYNIYSDLYLRSGLDRFNFSNTDEPVRPSFGFSYFYSLSSFKVGIDYAFVLEPYSSGDHHIIGININF